MEYFERYQRHSLIDWFSQELVSGTRIAVIGHIDIFDCDSVDVHNLTRSVLFREEDAGQPKARVAAARLQALNPQITVRAFARGRRPVTQRSRLPCPLPAAKNKTTEQEHEG